LQIGVLTLSTCIDRVLQYLLQQHNTSHLPPVVGHCIHVHSPWHHQFLVPQQNSKTPCYGFVVSPLTMISTLLLATACRPGFGAPNFDSGQVSALFNRLDFVGVSAWAPLDGGAGFAPQELQVGHSQCWSQCCSCLGAILWHPRTPFVTLRAAGGCHTQYLCRVLHTGAGAFVHAGANMLCLAFVSETRCTTWPHLCHNCPCVSWGGPSAVAKGSCMKGHLNNGQWAT
jgi:hypothetical protein